MIDRILALMKERGVNDTTVVRDAGLTRGVITQWKQGKSKPSTDAIVKIADYFGVTTDYLLGKTDAPLPSGQGADSVSHKPGLLNKLPASAFAHAMTGTNLTDEDKSAGFIIVPRCVLDDASLPKGGVDAFGKSIASNPTRGSVMAFLVTVLSFPPDFVWTRGCFQLNSGLTTNRYYKAKAWLTENGYLLTEKAYDKEHNIHGERYVLLKDFSDAYAETLNPNVDDMHKEKYKEDISMNNVSQYKRFSSFPFSVKMRALMLESGRGRSFYDEFYPKGMKRFFETDKISKEQMDNERAAAIEREPEAKIFFEALTGKYDSEIDNDKLACGESEESKLLCEVLSRCQIVSDDMGLDAQLCVIPGIVTSYPMKPHYGGEHPPKVGVVKQSESLRYKTEYLDVDEEKKTDLTIRMEKRIESDNIDIPKIAKKTGLEKASVISWLSGERVPNSHCFELLDGLLELGKDVQPKDDTLETREAETGEAIG